MNATATASDTYRLAKHRRRKAVNAVALTLSMLAMAFGLFWLIWILIETDGQLPGVGEQSLGRRQHGGQVGSHALLGRESKHFRRHGGGPHRCSLWHGHLRLPARNNSRPL